MFGKFSSSRDVSIFAVCQCLSSSIKKFSQLLLMADYSNSNQPDLVAYHTYYFKLLSSRQKSKMDED
jgi:hypothetical protein